MARQTAAGGAGMTVAFQGERGAYSEEAAVGLLGEGLALLPCRTFREAFQAVEDGRATHALIPIENSLAGSINESYDLLLERSLSIAAEAVLRVRHCLLALPGETLAGMRRVTSHPQALAQCSRFIEEHGLEPVAAYDTAGSAKALAETRPAATAAIAGRRAAQLYGLHILAEDIERDPGNYTRFYLVTRPPADPKAGVGVNGAGAGDGWAKTVLVFATAHRPGSLYWCLGAFAYRGIDLLKLESRPIQGKPWEYLFYADIRGLATGTNVAEALRELETKATMIRILGSFEAAR